MPLLPFIWLLMEVQSAKHQALTKDPFVIILFSAIAIVLVAMAYMYKKRQLSLATYKETLRQKLDAYLSAQIIHFALLEGSALFATIALYLTANYLFIVIYLVTLFLFSLSRPSLERTNRELQLNKEERTVLIDRKEIE